MFAFRYQLNGQESKMHKILEFDNFIMNVQFSPNFLQVLDFEHEIVVLYLNKL